MKTLALVLLSVLCPVALAVGWSVYNQRPVEKPEDSLHLTTVVVGDWTTRKTTVIRTPARRMSESLPVAPLTDNQYASLLRGGYVLEEVAFDEQLDRWRFRDCETGEVFVPQGRWYWSASDGYLSVRASDDSPIVDAMRY